MKTLLTIALLTLGLNLSAQDVLGNWKTIDDKTGKEKSIVQLYMKGDQLYGKVIKLLNRAPGDENPICVECKDDRKGQRLLGMEIIRGLKPDDELWADGKIMDPENGKNYDCKLWVDKDNPNQLMVRGYVAFMFRTQVWERIN